MRRGGTEAAEAGGPADGRLALPRASGLTLRQVRLGSGLVLCAYVLTHLIVHALGNASLGAMEAGLAVKAALWRSPPALVLLYGSLLAHLALGLYALYERRFFRIVPAEIAQLVLGLALPALLVTHVVGTRLAWSLEGLDRGYAQVLYGTWIAAPWHGALQVAGLAAAWLHGCLGLHYWLRLKPGYGRAAPWLIGLAVLVPALAVLGTAQGARDVRALSAEPAWRASALGIRHMGLPDQAAHLLAWRDGLLWGYAGALALVLAARGLRTRAETRGGFVRVTYPNGRTVRVPRGASVLEASRRGRIPHASVCGGRGRCSTCRVRIADGEHGGSLPPPGRAERAVLERIGASPGIRLACQLRPERDLTVAPLFTPHAQHGPAAERAETGEERFVAVMFVDLRGSTRLAEERLPYDTVFVINRFLSAVGQAVRDSGGSVNQQLGDGLMALFGLGPEPTDPGTAPKAAARDALRAVEAIGVAVERLNAVLAHDLGERLRYGIGLHAGMAIVGAMGDALDARFTALGDTVNVAARLEGLTGPMGQVAIVSEAVYRAAQLPAEDLQELTLSGRARSLRARLIAARDA
jgi:adenylate cyclase